MSTIGSHALLAYERGIAGLILSTVVEATPHLGRPPSRSYVASILTGSVRSDVVASDGHRLGTFAVLAGQGVAAVTDWIDTMVQRGLLEVLQGRRSLICTAEGRRVLESMPTGLVPIGLVPGAVASDLLDLAVRSGLLDALRRYRAERANEAEAPEHRLLSDATLREICTAAPDTSEALAALPGMGPKHVAVYGMELLRIVAEHKPIMERLTAARVSS